MQPSLRFQYRYFLSWMIGTALVLLLIAIYFLRNQIKPIQQLAEAAESFGRGRPLPKGFHPQGADEVRRAGIAFLRMRERIERQIEQRTMMLSGVSHDLRTILTRFKLQLTLVNTDFDMKPLEQDVSDMQNMLEDYLAFACGEGSESVKTFDLDALMQKFSADVHLHKRQFSYSIEGLTHIQVRPRAFTRLVNNLVSNAFCYANTVHLTAISKQESLIITIDDDSPGIHENMHTEVFTPFFRLDKARNQDASGTGLGLSIAQNIARSHGGNIQLNDSPLEDCALFLISPSKILYKLSIKKTVKEFNNLGIPYSFKQSVLQCLTSTFPAQSNHLKCNIIAFTNFKRMYQQCFNLYMRWMHPTSQKKPLPINNRIIPLPVIKMSEQQFFINCQQ